MESKLFIIVSTLFGHIVDSASCGRTCELGEGARALSFNDRDIPSSKPISEKRLRELLVESIRSNPAADVWVIVHMTCFDGILKDDEKRAQIRLQGEEAKLRDALIAAGIDAPQNLGIYGFHHEDIAPVWKVLQEFKTPVPADYSQRLTSALRSSEADNLFNRLTVVKHQIVGLFLPIDLTLQNWAETNDPELRERVVAALEKKVTEAGRLLNVAQKIVQESGKDSNITSLHDLLLVETAQNAAQGAISFHKWINQVDQALDELRRVTVL